VAVDAATGAQAWKTRIRAHPHSSVAVSPDHEMLFVGDNLALLHAVDTRNGRHVWKVQLDQTRDDESDIKTTPTVVEQHDLVVVGAWSDKVHAFDIESGDLVWETDLGANIMGSTAYAPSRDLVFVGTLSPTRSLHALDVVTGEEVWRTEIGSVMSSPAINGDESLVVVGSGLGKVYAVDVDTGDVVWEQGVGGAVTGSPALWNDQVFITAKKGDLVAFDTGP
jgi:outer membrane protein assembly factor BamB